LKHKKGQSNSGSRGSGINFFFDRFECFIRLKGIGKNKENVEKKKDPCSYHECISDKQCSSEYHNEKSSGPRKCDNAGDE